MMVKYLSLQNPLKRNLGLMFEVKKFWATRLFNPLGRRVLNLKPFKAYECGVYQFWYTKVK